MLAPTVAAGLSAILVLYLTHRRALPPHLKLPSILPALVLADPWGAVFGTVNLAVCLALLAAAPSLRFPMWAVTLVCAGATCAHNLVTYVAVPWGRAAVTKRRLRGQGGGRSEVELLPHGQVDGSGVDGGGVDAASSSKHFGGSGGGGAVEGVRVAATAALAVDGSGRSAAENEAAAAAPNPWQRYSPSPLSTAAAEELVALPIAATPTPEPTAATDALPSPAAAAAAADDLRSNLTSRCPSFLGPFAGVPWDVVPLVLGFFVLVEGLSVNGWVERLGGLLGGSAQRMAPGAGWGLRVWLLVGLCLDLGGELGWFVDCLVEGQQGQWDSTPPPPPPPPP